MPIFDASMSYQKEKTPLIIIAGKEYGTCSSRDWAAKGTLLLGVKAVIAESYERIHRSNLVGMGRASLKLTGEETFSLVRLEALSPGRTVTLVIESDKSDVTSAKRKGDSCSSQN